MTLPNAILFPQAMLPLYIFETKYRKMLKYCLDNDRVFAVALARENEGKKVSSPEPCDVATVGLIRASVDNPDGTSHLILQGLVRVRLLEFTQIKPFRIARVEPMFSVNSSGQDVADLMRRVAHKAMECLSKKSQMPDVIKDFIDEVQDPDLFSDMVGYTLVNDIRQKQHLLETPDVCQRLNDLIPMLG